MKHTRQVHPVHEELKEYDSIGQLNDDGSTDEPWNEDDTDKYDSNVGRPSAPATSVTAKADNPIPHQTGLRNRQPESNEEKDDESIGSFTLESDTNVNLSSNVASETSMVGRYMQVQVIKLQQLQQDIGAPTNGGAGSSSPAAVALSSTSPWFIPAGSCRISRISLVGAGSRGSVVSGSVPLSTFNKSMQTELRNTVLVDQAGRIECALKRVKRQANQDSRMAQKCFAQEIHHTLSLQHPSVVQGFGFTHDRDGQLHLILRRYELSLADKEQARDHIEASDRVTIALDMIAGVEYLHSHGLLHRDIHPGNIFLYRDQEGRLRACLGDLGFLCPIDPTNRDMNTFVFVHTERYSAPESQPSVGQIQLYSVESDIYSLAKVALQLVKPLAYTNKIAEFIDIIDKGTDKDPSKRTTVDQLKNAVEDIGRTIPAAARIAEPQVAAHPPAKISKRRIAGTIISVLVLLAAVFYSNQLFPRFWQSTTSTSSQNKEHRTEDSPSGGAANPCMINEGGCSSQRKCTSVEGVRKCGACPPNFYADSETTCAPVNPCLSNGPDTKPHGCDLSEKCVWSPITATHSCESCTIQHQDRLASRDHTKCVFNGICDIRPGWSNEPEWERIVSPAGYEYSSPRPFEFRRCVDPSRYIVDVQIVKTRRGGADECASSFGVGYSSVGSLTDCTNRYSHYLCVKRVTTGHDGSASPLVSLHTGDTFQRLPSTPGRHWVRTNVDSKIRDANPRKLFDLRHDCSGKDVSLFHAVASSKS